MKALRIIAAAAALLVAYHPTLPVAQAHEVSLGDIKRTNLLRNDLSAAGREVIQVLVEFGPGVQAVRHSHPGEEFVYVTEGSPRVSARRPAAGDHQGRRSALHPARNAAFGEERRHRSRRSSLPPTSSRKANRFWR